MAKGVLSNERARGGVILLAGSAAWLALSATIALWPPATIGLVILAASLVQGTVPRWRALLSAVRRHLVASYIWGAVTGAVLALVYALDRSQPVVPVTLRQANALKLGAALWLGVQLYALPLLIVQRRGGIFGAWRSALLLALSAPLFTALIFGAAALLVSVARTMPAPLALALPGALALLGAWAVARKLSAYGYPHDPPAP